MFGATYIRPTLVLTHTRGPQAVTPRVMPPTVARNSYLVQTHWPGDTQRFAYAQRGRGQRNDRAAGGPPLALLSAVVRPLSGGSPHQDIATRLFISPRTVKTLKETNVCAARTSGGTKA